MVCPICNIRKPRRYCPGVHAEICSICCGEQREVTIGCPLDCEYLQEARAREKKADLSNDDFPNRDIRLSEDFLRQHEPLLLVLAAAIAKNALEDDACIDNDVRQALEALIRTHRTLQTGLIYDSRPDNPLAAKIYTTVQSTVEDLRRRITEHGGLTNIRDADVLGVLVFLQRLELQHNNGRPKGRAFIDFLRHYFPQKSPESLLV